MRYSDAGLMTCTSKDPETDELDYEVELCVVIGKTVPRRTTKEDAMEYVLGYTVAHDVRVGPGRRVAISLCTMYTAHPLHIRFTNRFGASGSETTMRPNPR
jgi:hypothetical protein